MCLLQDCPKNCSLIPPFLSEAHTTVLKHYHTTILKGPFKFILLKLFVVSWLRDRDKLSTSKEIITFLPQLLRSRFQIHQQTTQIAGISDHMASVRLFECEFHVPDPSYGMPLLH